jgi:ATP-binding cassette subfamily F protein 3
MGTTLVVSHDRYFISKLATRIIEITAEGSIKDYRISNIGNAYDEFIEAKSTHSQASVKIENTQNITSSNKEQYLIKKKQLADERREQTRQKRLTEEMKSLEEEIESINQRMSGEEASNYMLIAELDKRLQECEERLLEIYEELSI